MKTIAGFLLIGAVLATNAWADNDGAKIPVCRVEVMEENCKEEFFGSNLSEHQFPLNRCMNEMMICRRYGELSNKLLAAINRTQGSLPPIQQYFLGSSLYRLHMQTRSEGIRCELGNLAKDHLQDFLISAKLKFDETGTFGSVGLRYIRDAVNSVEILDRPSDCVESAISAQALYSVAKARPTTVQSSAAALR
ncbi:MAG: hypothetical protein EOP04_29350, partial [Proteobacteria bacterium]